MKNLLLPALGSVFLALPALADELEPAYVPAESRFVLHFDMEAFLETELWQIVSEEKELMNEIEVDGLQEFRDEFGLDPLEDLYSITVFGSKIEDGSGTIIAVTSDRIEDAIGRLSLEEGYERFQEGGMVLHSVEGTYAHVMERRDGRRVVVVGEERGEVLSAASVVQGHARSLSDGQGALNPRPAAGSIVHLSAIDFSGLDEFEPASQVFGLAQGIQFDFGEAGRSLFANVTVDTDTPEAALDIADTVEGLMALARLALRNQNEVPSEVRGLLSSVRVNTGGNSVTIDFEYGTRALFDLVRSLEDL